MEYLNTISARPLARLVSSGGLLLLATWAMLREEPVWVAMAPYAIHICVGALSAAALLSWYHDYARVLCVTVAVGFVVWTSSGPADGPFIPKLIPAILLPLNFALFGWLKDHGVLTTGGLLKIGALVVQAVGILFVTQGDYPQLEALIEQSGPAGEWTWMPWSVLLSFVATCVFLLFLTYRRRTKVEPALMWALGAGFVGLNEGATEYVFLYTGVAGLILLLGVLEHTYDIAYLDELTGLPNRRAFNEAYRLLRGRYTIAMCDVDHFKEFNDLFGHETGDQVLRMIASRLSRVRGGGRVYRYGGEEFAIIFRRRTAEQVRPVAESLREAVAERKFLLRGHQRDLETDSQKPKAKREKEAQRSVQVTISIGLADRTGSRATPKIVLGTADTALYLAKKSGRNCVILADETVVTEQA